MKLYLDSADPRQWQLPPGGPPIQGVTTNPALVHQAGMRVTLDTYLRLVREASGQGLKELMLQLPRPLVSEAHDWLRELIPAAALAGVRLTIKLPCHPDWTPIIRAVHDWDTPLLLTGLSNPLQLLWASSQSARFVAPYLGRLQADGRDIWSLVGACVALQPDGLQLLAASIKTEDALSQLIARGAYAATLRPEFAASLVTDPLTDQAIADFAVAIDSSLAHPPKLGTIAV
jgi:transaldolase